VPTPAPEPWKKNVRLRSRVQMAQLRNPGWSTQLLFITSVNGLQSAPVGAVYVEGVWAEGGEAARHCGEVGVAQAGAQLILHLHGQLQPTAPDLLTNVFHSNPFSNILFISCNQVGGSGRIRTFFVGSESYSGYVKLYKQRRRQKIELLNIFKWFFQFFQVK